MKLEKDDKCLTFISENAEEKKLLTNYGYRVPYSYIKQARIVYFNKYGNNNPLIFEARCNPMVYVLLDIAKYLWSKKDIELLKQSGLPYPDDEAVTHNSKIIRADFKTGKLLRPYAEVEW